MAYNQESVIVLNMKIKTEKGKRNGLIIIEAYFGKYEHVTDIIDGISKFYIPETKEKYL